MQVISDITIVKSKSGAAYEVPYNESFGSSASVNEYTIIDANNDGTTCTGGWQEVYFLAESSWLCCFHA